MRVILKYNGFERTATHAEKFLKHKILFSKKATHITK